MSVAECLAYISVAAMLALICGGLATYFCVPRCQDHLNLNSAESRARELLAQAANNAENVVKSAELKAKDEIYQKREEYNREVEQFKNKQRDQERTLEKKEDLHEQKQQTLVKKDRHLQQTER